MRKRDYGNTEVWQECVDVLGDGGLLLVSAGADGKPNVMTIGWALLGIVWSKPIMKLRVTLSTDISAIDPRYCTSIFLITPIAIELTNAPTRRPRSAY